jgi:hypothetical protein
MKWLAENQQVQDGIHMFWRVFRRIIDPNKNPGVSAGVLHFVFSLEG